MFLAPPRVFPSLPPRIPLPPNPPPLRVVDLRVPAVGLGLHIVPPHVLLPLREQPRGLVRHRTGLARQTPVDVEHEGELPLRVPLLVGIEHLPPELPVIDFRHGFPPFCR